MFRRRTKRLLTDSEVFFQRYLDVMTVFSILFLLLGIIFSILSSYSFRFYNLLLGLFLLIFGIIEVPFFFKRRQFSYFRFSGVKGLIISFLGIIFFFIDINKMEYSFIFLAIYIFINVVEKFGMTFCLFRLHDKSFIVMMVHSLLLLMLGILLWINPFHHLLFAEVLGIFIILYHILNLSILSLLQKRISEFVSCFD